MPHNEKPPTVGRGRGLEGIDSCEGVISATPNPPNQAPILPRVAEARARDAAARERLRGTIPRTMAALEKGRAWWKAAQRRAAVFPPKDGEGTS